MLRRRNMNYVPKDYERGMSALFLEHKQVWSPVLVNLNNTINKDNDTFNRVRLDTKIIPLVLALALHNIPTSMSCEGHPARKYTNPAESTRPYVVIDEKPNFHLNVEEQKFIDDMVHTVYERMKKKGEILGDDLYDSRKRITDRRQMTIPTLGFFLYQEVINNFMSWQSLKSRKRDIKTHKSELLQYKNIKRLYNLIDDYSLEISNKNNIKPKIIEVAKSQHILIFSANAGNNVSLELAQESMIQFGDYLFARYLAEYHNVISTYNT